MRNLWRRRLRVARSLGLTLLAAMLLLGPGCWGSEKTGPPVPAAGNNTKDRRPAPPMDGADSSRVNTPSNGATNAGGNASPAGGAGSVDHPSGGQTDPAVSVARFRHHAEQIDSPELAARDEAIEAINRLAKENRRQLLTWLAHDDPVVRRGAAFGLLKGLDPSEDSEVDAFLTALRDEDAQVRRVALQAVNQLDDAVVANRLAALTPALTSGGATATAKAAIARRLARLGPAAEAAIPPLKEAAATSPDRNVRAASIAALHRILADPREAVTVFAELLASEPDAGLKRVLVDRIAGRGEAGAAAVPQMTEALKTPDAEVQMAAVIALARLGAAARPALEEIDRLAGGDAASERVQAAATEAAEIIRGE